jgi:hypothetical protein
MRLTLVTVYAVIFMALCACERENTIAEMQRETREKLMGYWQLEKKRVEIFDPYPTLQSETVYVGTTEDFLHFKANDSVITGAAGRPVKEEKAYINVTSLIISSTPHNWFIDSLKSHRLILYCLVRNDDTTLRTRRETLYFKR